MKPEHIDSVVSTQLHNFLLKIVPSSYVPPECFDCENISEGTTSMEYEAQNDYNYSLKRNNLAEPPYRSKNCVRIL